MKLGIERLVEEPALRKPLLGRRVALLAHPASVTRDLTHSLDALAALPALRLTAAFGPQHGLRGDKQYNMVESADYVDPLHRIPVFSLYGSVRRPTAAMMDTFDVLLVDLQDLGCRIYTFITTLRYVLEEAARARKAVWVLDRPNPAGRPDWDDRAPLVRDHAAPRCGIPGDTDAGLEAGRGAGLRLAVVRAQLGEPEPQRS